MDDQKTGVEMIAAERQRQLEKKEWTPEHDDMHVHGELAAEAGLFVLEETCFQLVSDGMCCSADARRAKPRLRQLAIAGALIAAEIDRLQRAEALGITPQPCPDCYGGHFRPCQLCGDAGYVIPAAKTQAV